MGWGLVSKGISWAQGLLFLLMTVWGWKACNSKTAKPWAREIGYDTNPWDWITFLTQLSATFLVEVENQDYRYKIAVEDNRLSLPPNAYDDCDAAPTNNDSDAAPTND